ncbi:MAG: hypothetical protein Kow0069_29060 [Promethearchaeota archaeon]
MGDEFAVERWSVGGSRSWGALMPSPEFSSVCLAWGVWLQGGKVYAAGVGTGYGDQGTGAAHVLTRWSTDGNLESKKVWAPAQISEALGIWGSGNVVYTAGYSNPGDGGASDLLVAAWDASTLQLLWNSTWDGETGERRSAGGGGGGGGLFDLNVGAQPAWVVLVLAAFSVAFVATRSRERRH